MSHWLIAYEVCIQNLPAFWGFEIKKKQQLLGKKILKKG